MDIFVYSFPCLCSSHLAEMFRINLMKVMIMNGAGKDIRKRKQWLISVGGGDGCVGGKRSVERRRCAVERQESDGDVWWRDRWRRWRLILRLSRAKDSRRRRRRLWRLRRSATATSRISRGDFDEGQHRHRGTSATSRDIIDIEGHHRLRRTLTTITKDIDAGIRRRENSSTPGRTKEHLIGMNASNSREIIATTRLSEERDEFRSSTNGMDSVSGFY